MALSPSSRADTAGDASASAPGRGAEDALRSIASVLAQPDPVRERKAVAFASLADWVDTTARATHNLRKDLTSSVSKLRDDILSSEHVLAREVTAREKLAATCTADRARAHEMLRQLVEAQAAQRSAEAAASRLQERVDTLEDSREVFVQRVVRELRSYRSEAQTERAMVQKVAEERATELIRRQERLESKVADLAKRMNELRTVLDRSIVEQQQEARRMGDRIVAVEATVRRMNERGEHWRDVKDASSAVASMDQVLTRLRTPARTNRSVESM